MSTNIYPPSRRPCPVVTGLDDDEEEGSTGPVRCVSIASRSRELSSSKRMVSAPCIMQTPSNILLFMRTLNQHASPSASANVPRSVSMDLARELDAEAQQAAEDEMQVRLAALRVQAIKRRLQPAVVLSICKTCGVFVCQACKEHCCKGHTVFEHKFVGSPIARECGCKFKSNSVHNLTTDQHPQCCSRASLPRHATVPAMRKLPSVPGSSDLLRHFAEKSDTTSIASTNANSEISIEGQCPTVNTPPSPTIGDISRDAPLQRMGYITAQDVCVAQTVKNSMARLKASQPTGAVGDKPNACACVVM